MYRQWSWRVAAALVVSSTLHAQAVRGRVVDDGGRPVARAEVQVIPSGRPVLTDASGKFDLGTLANGTYTVRVRRVGFEVTTDRIIVPVQAPSLTFVLKRAAAMLDTMHATAIEQRLPRVFERVREHLGASIYGPALDSMFARGGSRSLADMLPLDRHLSLELRKPQTVAGGVTCVFVDGIRVRAWLESYISQSEISAVEVIASSDFVIEPFVDTPNIPPSNEPPCGKLVLIWSKYYQQPHWGGH